MVRQSAVPWLDVPSHRAGEAKGRRLALVYIPESEITSAFRPVDIPRGCGRQPVCELIETATPDRGPAAIDLREYSESLFSLRPKFLACRVAATPYYLAWNQPGISLDGRFGGEGSVLIRLLTMVS